APKPQEVGRAVPSAPPAIPAPAVAQAPQRVAAAPSLQPSITPPTLPSLFRISPRAAALARDCVIDPSRITGSGPAGRVVEKDVKAYLDTRGYCQLRISPAAKQLA